MKKLGRVFAVAIISAFFIAGSFFAPEDASAVPSFARQTGHACTTCHFNAFPSLNSFGRAFKAGGFTDIGQQGKIEDEGLSIPNTLNASLVTKFRYQKSSTKGSSGKSGTDKGELQFPDEAAIFLAGRAAENVGYALEFNAGTPENAMFASFKAPIMLLKGDTNIGLVLFLTDGSGASYGFEPFNTGANRMQRPWEARKVMSDQQYTLTKGAMADMEMAEGFALYAATDMFFVNATLWGPAWGKVDTGLELSQYLRAGITPNVGGWDLGVGIQYWGGETKVGNTDATPANAYVTKATAIDAQAQGEVGGMPLGVYLYGQLLQSLIQGALRQISLMQWALRM